jgi:hypothetical protein
MHLLTLFQLAATDCATTHGLLPSLYDGFCANGSTDVTISSLYDVLKIIANVTRILIAISGSLAVILLLVASIMFITATGDPSRIKRAREIIINTVTGLVLILVAYAVVTFVAGEF